MSESKKVKLGFAYFKDPKYLKVKKYIETKHSYLANMGRLELGEREGYEIDVQWKLVSDLMEFIEQIEIQEDITNNKVSTLRVDS